jgi:hypothetical protein
MALRTTARTAAVAAVGTTLALSLTGCLGESGEGTNNTVNLSAAAALAAASEKTSKADTFKAELAVSDSSAEDFRVRASGQFKLRPELAFSVKLNQISAGGQTLPINGAQAIVVGDTGYGKVPGIAQRFLGGDKPWVKVNLREASQQFGFGLNQLVTAVQRINPAEQTKMMTSSKDARRVGEETVDGVRTTHYKGSITVREAIKQLDPATRERVRDLHANLDEKVNFDIWVDGDQLPRKLQTTGGTATITVTYHDYGKSVTVNAPPADQVGELRLPRN